MIRLVTTRNDFFKKLNLEMIIKKIEYARESGAIKYHLQNLHFDETYTKPANLTGWDILDILYTLDVAVIIGSYTQNFFAWRFTPVNAYKPANKFNQIFINLRQLNNRSAIEWEETVWHELVHVADHLSAWKFDHGTNDLSGKSETAPVKFAKTMAAMTLPIKKEVERV